MKSGLFGKRIKLFWSDLSDSVCQTFGVSSGEPGIDYIWHDTHIPTRQQREHILIEAATDTEVR